ncbi:MAG: hypothetical protein WC007_14505 [Pelobacteraceae bacterium]
MSRAANVFWSIVLFVIITGFTLLIWWAAGGFSFWEKMLCEALGWGAVAFGCLMSDGVAIPVRIVK